MNRSTRVFSLFVVFCLLINSVAPLARAQDQSDTDSETQPAGLRFRLSQAPDQPETKPRSKVAASTVLSESETANIIKRMTPIKAEAPDEQEFAMRERGPLPPRTGDTIKVSFPGPEGVAPPRNTASDPLEVLRYSPEGEVPLAPQFAITFSRPMVALSSQEEAAANVPVQLSPQPPGKWRWLGTRTLAFDPTERFPMATEYSVTVPAGTKSTGGGTLANAKSWTFTTPTPTIVQSYPGKEHTQSRDTLMFIAFDQRIDPAAMINSIQVKSGDTALPTRLATDEEVAADSEVKQRVEATPNDRWLAFRIINPQALPAGADITVEVAAGAPSLEGPLRTKAAPTFSFTSYGPLHVAKSQCGYDGSCRPNSATQIWFNNRLDAAAFDESQVHVEPALPGLKVGIVNESLTISGVKKANTRYTVTFSKGLQDIFGQTLESEESVSFNIAMSSPVLALSVDGMAVLDPAGPRSVSLYSINYQHVKVSLYGVGPEHWTSFNAYRRLRWYARGADQQTPVPGRLITSKVVDLRSSADEVVETLIDLTPALHDGAGQVLVAVESIMAASDRRHDPLMAWVQLTNIGLDAIADNHELLGWASSLVDGAPLSGVQLQILPAGIEGVTNSDGTAHLAFKPYKDSPPSLLVARRGGDVAFLPEDAEWWGISRSSWQNVSWSDELRWYVFDDRKLYRPGEDVHLKGWLRRIGRNKGGDVGLLTGPPLKLNYSVTDNDDNEVAKGDVTLNAFGGFDTAFKLPLNMNLGNATVQFETDNDEGEFHDQTYSHSFTVQEFRRPEFEVTASRDNEGELFPGSHADISVAANYFAGGGLADAEVKWEVSSQSTNFTPPNRSDYSFGVWTPWWENFGDSGAPVTKEFAGKTDQNGKHRLRIDFDSMDPPRPSVVVAQASVTDVNRQSWTATTSLLVHPADLYVGLKSDRLFVKQGEPLAIHAIVTDLDCKLIVNREIKMRAVRLDWQQLKGEWTQVKVEPQDCTIKSGAADAKCAFKTPVGGVYSVTATIRDDRGRANESTLTLWVDGGRLPARQGVDQQKVQLIPDQREYKAGDTAEVLVQTPFYPAEGVMTLRRSGVLESRRFKLDGPTYTLRVPIQESWTPNVHVQVDLIGAVDRSDEGVSAKRPAFASGEISLTISPSSRGPTLVARPRSRTMLPGEKTAVDVEVKDADGKPVADSEVALVVVDESVLALTNYKVADPITAFYSARESGANDYHSRKWLVLADAKALGEDKEQFIRQYWARNGGGTDVNASMSLMTLSVSDLPILGRNFAMLVPSGVRAAG